MSDFNISDEHYENFFGKTGLGLLGGGLAGLILFRSPTARSSVALFGAGVGSGVAGMDFQLSKKGLNYKEFSFEVPEMPFSLPDFNTEAPAAPVVAPIKVELSKQKSE
jgi:hypothetical protein